LGNLLGIDLGTSGVKALLCDEEGRVLGRFGQAYDTMRPHPHWAEQDPNQWWSAVVAVLKAVTRFRIDVVGLTGQMHGPVFIGPDGHSLHPCIIWADTRARRESIALKKRLSAARILDVTGNPAGEAFTAPKILWIEQERPQVFERVHKILLPKDFIGLRLTEEFATDHSDASGTLLYDIRAGTWSDEIIAELNIRSSLLPDILDSSAILGQVTSTAARQTGLVEGTPVVVGAGDLATAAVGGGIGEGRTPLVNIGTAAQVIVPLSSLREDLLGKLYVFRQAVPEKLFAMGTVPAAGASIQWYRNNLGMLESLVAKDLGIAVYDVLDRLASQAPPGARGLFFLPYFFGTGNPHLDYRAQGALIGLTAMHSRAEMVRALMEGVAYGLKDCLKAFEIRPTEIRMGSGGAKSTLWRQIIADTLGAGVAVVKEKDLSAFGACLLAGVAVGVYRNLEEAWRRVQIEELISPDDNNQRIYAAGYGIFSSLYGRLRSSFHEIDRFSSLAENGREQ